MGTLHRHPGAVANGGSCGPGGSLDLPSPETPQPPFCLFRFRFIKPPKSWQSDKEAFSDEGCEARMDSHHVKEQRIREYIFLFFIIFWVGIVLVGKQCPIMETISCLFQNLNLALPLLQLLPFFFVYKCFSNVNTTKWVFCSPITSRVLLNQLMDKNEINNYRV